MESASPSKRPQKDTPKEETSAPMNFSSAINMVVNGKKISKLEWNNREEYGVLKDGFLMLHKPDDQFYKWIISEGDLMGTDWIVI